MMKEKTTSKIIGGDDEQADKRSWCGRGRAPGDGRKRRCAGSEALSLRLRSTENDRLRNSRRYLQRQPEGAEQGHHADRPVSRRAARTGAAGAAARQIG